MRLGRITCVLVALAALLGPIGVHADILVNGGCAAQRASIADVYSRFPACVKTDTTVAVRLLDAGGMEAFVRSGLDPVTARSVSVAGVDGVYQNSSPTITLRDGGDPICVCCTFSHEYGHFVWQRLLSDAERRDYAAVYRSQKSAHSLVTDYAATSVEEGFAEAFSYAMVRPAVLASRDSLSAAFLAKVFARRGGGGV